MKLWKRGRTKRDRQRKFLRAFRRVGTIARACELTRISRVLAHHWVNTDSSFARRFAEARATVVERLESSAYERAMSGNTSLTMFMLKAMRPEVYRDKYEDLVDEEELNTAIERELERMAASGETTIPRVIEGTVGEDGGPPEAAGVPQPDVP
jgi:hypothetical protein